MEEKTIYLSKDGTRFDQKQDCLEWDQVCEPIAELEHWINTNDFPDGLKDFKQTFQDLEVDWSDVVGLGFGKEKGEWIRYIKCMNYLSNYILYGSANPSKTQHLS